MLVDQDSRLEFTLDRADDYTAVLSRPGKLPEPVTVGVLSTRSRGRHKLMVADRQNRPIVATLKGEANRATPDKSVGPYPQLTIIYWVR